MQRQPVIGILTPIIGGNYYTSVIQSLQQAAMEINAKLVYVVTGGKYFDIPLSLDYVDGWIVISHAVEDHFLQELVQYYKRPIVTIGKDIRQLKIDGSMVMTNNELGVEQAIQHLYDHGHRKIGILGSIAFADLQQRFRAYLNVMNKLGLEIKQEYIFDYGDMTVYGGRQAAEKIVLQNYDLTAVLCCTDMSAYGMAEKLQELGYKVPQDIAIVGFDNSPTAMYSPTPMTSVAQNFAEIARIAFEELIQRIDSPQPFRLITIETSLFIRESCGCTPVKKASIDQPFQDIENEKNYLSNKQNLNYEFNRYISNNRVKRLRELTWLLESFFDAGCVALQDGYHNSKDPRIKVTEYFDFKTRTNLLNNDVVNSFENLKSFPPMLSNEYGTSPEVVYVIPYRVYHNNWSSIAFSTTHKKSQIQHHDYMGMVSLFEGISNAFDRISLIDEVKNINHHRTDLMERYDIINRVSEEILFEIDFNKKTVWANRDIVVQPKNSIFLGLEEYIHPNDIPEIKKHFYDHYRDNKPFFIEIRIKNQYGNYYSVYVSGESTRDKYGNIEKLVGTIRDVMLSRKQLHTKKYHLPSIMSRREFYSEIKNVIQQENTKFALLVIDIDNFKVINDSYGLSLGDEIIDIIFDVLLSSIKSEDRISRFGGDEFIVLFHYNELKEVEEFAKHILVSSTTKVTDLQHDLKFSISMGYSLYPDDGTEYEDLMRKSDIALFYMKHNGKSNFKRFDSSMMDYQQDKRRMEKLLRDALAYDRFKLVFQPQVNVHTQKVYGVEVLLRLTTETGTIIPPDQFISVAERLGLIIPIGEWVIRAACKQAVDWLFKGYAPIRISINISGHQLKSVQFINAVKDILEETGMNPALLTFEITETTIIEQTDQVMAAIEELKSLGIVIAIDDFGISYSSLSVLKDFPIEILKIDKSFIREMGNNHKGYKIVNAIINIGKSLDMKIVAEGVETFDQLKMLDQLECHYCQGYYISKPIDANCIESFLPLSHIPPQNMNKGQTI